MSVTRGTTPTHIFNVDADLTGAEAIYITYRQRNGTVLEKGIEDIAIQPGQLQISLTQEDTLLFDTNAPVSIQIRARFPDGTAIASNIVNISANVILKEGVI